MVEFCRRITRNESFGRLVIILITLSGLLVGLETYPQFDESTSAGQVVQWMQLIILGFFVIEILMKIVASFPRPWEFFREPWNIFDFLIVGVCLMPLNLHSMAVVRLVRILRTLRMITVLPRLRLLVSALLKSIPSLGYIGILLGLHFYIYSVIGTVLFRGNDPIRFGSLHSTAATLFQVLTLEGWNDVRDTQVMGSDMTYDDSWKQSTEGARTSEARPVASTVYFVSFILLGTMIMLNLFTGVIISSMEEAQVESPEGAREEQLHQQGFLTLHDELRLLGVQIQELNEKLNQYQLK